MSDANTLIADRLAISDVIIRYATALDTRDWRLLRSILTDRVAIDCDEHHGLPVLAQVCGLGHQ